MVWAETDKLGCANVYFNVRQNSFFLVTFQSKYSWCSKLYSKNVETTTFAQEASQPSFPYTNLVVCNYAVAGNLISGSMYSQVVKLNHSPNLRCLINQLIIMPPKPYNSPSSSLSGNCLLLVPLLYNLRGLLVSSCMNCPLRWLFLLFTRELNALAVRSYIRRNFLDISIHDRASHIDYKFSEHQTNDERENI